MTVHAGLIAAACGFVAVWVVYAAVAVFKRVRPQLIALNHPHVWEDGWWIWVAADHTVPHFEATCRCGTTFQLSFPDGAFEPAGGPPLFAAYTAAMVEAVDAGRVQVIEP